MGLDQYAFVKDNAEQEEGTEIAYWRKHNRLQGWMEARWASKGNTGDFNCVNFILDDADIDALELAIAKKDLPKTEGFFFGRDSYNDIEGDTYSYHDSDVAFIAKAREALAADKILYYVCSW